MILGRVFNHILRRAMLLWLGAAACLWLSFGQSDPQKGNPPGQQAGAQQPNQSGQRGGAPNQAGRRGLTPEQQAQDTLNERRNMRFNMFNGVRMPDRPTGMTPPNLPVPGQSGWVVSQPSSQSAPVPTRPIPMMTNRPGVMPVIQPEEPSTMRLRLEGSNVTAEIRNTPLQSVLDELSAWSGVVFEVESQENPKVSVNFYRMPVESAVQRLVANDNSIAYYGKDESGQSRLTFVRIMARTPRPSPPVLRYIGTGTVSKRSDEVVDTPEQALTVLAGSANLVAREKAVEVLIETKSSAAVIALKAVLDDPAPEIRVAAIDGLASLDARDALPQILLALKDAHPGVRQSAVLAVGMLGDKANVKDLRPLLRDSDANVAAAATTVIQKLSVR